MELIDKNVMMDKYKKRLETNPCVNPNMMEVMSLCIDEQNRLINAFNNYHVVKEDDVTILPSLDRESLFAAMVHNSMTMQYLMIL